MTVSRRPIAIFGGTFDPVHYGHLRAAAEVCEALGDVDFRLLPSGQPPHRQRPQGTPRQRLDMLRLALNGHPDLQIDDREVRRDGPSYMVDTLASIRAEHPARSLMLILGQDAANDLHRWHRWQALFELCHIVVMTRPESASAYTDAVLNSIHHRHSDDITALHSEPHGLIMHLPVTQLAISSTDIRHQIENGHSPRFLLPDAVLHYIHNHTLYHR